MEEEGDAIRKEIHDLFNMIMLEFLPWDILRKMNKKKKKKPYLPMVAHHADAHFHTCHVRSMSTLGLRRCW